MIIKNRTKKLLSIFFIYAALTSCSTTKGESKSSGFLDKAKTAQDTYKKAEDAYSSADKITSKFKFKDNSKEAAGSSAVPPNIPPPGDLKDLPVYGNWMDRLFGKVIRVTSTVENGANQNFPIIYDLVFVKDPAIYAALTTTTTRDWFRIDAPEIQALQKETKFVEIQRMTAIPEQKSYAYLIRVPANVKAGLIFVRLVNNNNLYPDVFDPYQDISLDFSANNFTPYQQK